jgi:hypothetical protein
MMIKIISINFFALLICCSFKENKVNFTLKNQTKMLIDSVVIRSYGLKEVFKQIKPNDSISKSVSINYQGQSEGAWTIMIYSTSELKKSGTFGYYSNVSDIRKSYVVTIYDEFSYKEN